jgi:uncharacterized protein (UPF0335 family)
MLKSMKKPDPKKRKLGKAETVVAYQRKAPSSTTAPKSISKADTEAKMARIEGMKEEMAELTQGEKDFGPSYKSLGLKGTRRTEINPKTGDVSVKAKYKSIEGDEDVERIPDSEMLQVTKTGPAAGNDFSKFKETFKERIERIAAEKKASLRARAMNILEAEKRKAQSKAGM